LPTPKAAADCSGVSYFFPIYADHTALHLLRRTSTNATTGGSMADQLKDDRDEQRRKQSDQEQVRGRSQDEAQQDDSDDLDDIDEESDEDESTF
jgi:hypothetical protein